MRKVHRAAILGVCGLLLSFTSFTKFPEVEITNGIIHARIYLPDAHKGYYRSTRFDWSGVIPFLKYKNHTYYGKWFKKYDPNIDDAIMGPVESFAPLGYNEAKPGGGFIKIGIGVLEKPGDTPYSPYHYYKFLDPGKWHIKKRHNQVEFIHELSWKGYSYRYKKIVSLTKGKPEMVLIHSLKNTGKRTIETDVYDHNLFVIDNQPTGPGFVVKFPFKLSGSGLGIGNLAEIKNNQIIFLKKLTNHEHVYCKDLLGYSGVVKNYDIRVEDHITGAGVHITGNRPLSKLVFWAASTTLCPEAYIHIKVNPGETFRWEITYNFYTCSILN